MMQIAGSRYDSAYTIVKKTAPNCYLGKVNFLRSVTMSNPDVVSVKYICNLGPLSVFKLLRYLAPPLIKTPFILRVYSVIVFFFVNLRSAT